MEDYEEELEEKNIIKLRTMNTKDYESHNITFGPKVSLKVSEEPAAIQNPLLNFRRVSKVKGKKFIRK